MRKQVRIVFILAILAVAGGVLVWLQGSQRPGAPSPPSAPVAQEAGSSVVSAVGYAAEATPLSVAPGVSLVVPAGWSYVHGEPLTAFAARFAGEELLVLLWQSGPSFAEASVRASLVRMSRNGLDVPGYLAGLRAELAAAGLAVEPPALTATLREDGLPAGQVVFRETLPEGHGQWGVQYVFVDGEGDDFVVVSLAAAAGEASGAIDWVNWVRSLHLDEVS